MLQIRRILQLLQEGWSKRQIPKDLSISRYTIDDYEHKYVASWQSLASLLKLSDTAFWEALYPHEGSEKENNPKYDRPQKMIPSIISELLQVKMEAEEDYLTGIKVEAL